ncbi:MAG: hypothetical protein BroJett040_14030 [Oligoflexia bacterium]|nr:MAG: hypothetical protein BroJett040_14030 [Oligoflexia bacterium]
MKKAWVYTLSVFAVVAAMSLTACNQNKSSGPAPVLAPALVPYSVPPGTKIGFYAQTTNFNPYGYSNVGGSLSVQSGWTNMLKEAMGVCNREYSTGGYANCSSWMNGWHDIVFMMDGSAASSVQMIIRSMPYISNYYNYYYQFPKFEDLALSLLGFPVGSNPQGFFNPMILNSTIWPVNNSQGFEIRSYGPSMSQAYNKHIQLQVAQGKVEDGQFNFQLYYNGALAASGTMVRCQTQNCGL